MPGTLTYPGIYIEELPSGVHAIAGASTANTAFVDFFARGPMNQAVQITSLADFQRIFGGLDTRSEASYAIQQYYQNGGQIAWVVRVAAGTPGQAVLTLQGGSPAQNTLIVEAQNPGSWGNNLQVAVARIPGGDTFNLAVREAVTANGKTQVLNAEVFRNLTMDATQPSYAVSVVNAGSQLVQLTDAGLGDPPAGGAPTSNGGVPDSAYQALGGGSDGNRPDNAALKGDQTTRHGLYALDAIDPFIFNILCLPAAATLDLPANVNLNTYQTPLLADVYSAAAAYCEAKRAMLIVESSTSRHTSIHPTRWLRGSLPIAWPRRMPRSTSRA
jgi:hypothetical protein